MHIVVWRKWYDYKKKAHSHSYDRRTKDEGWCNCSAKSVPAPTDHRPLAVRDAFPILIYATGTGGAATLRTLRLFELLSISEKHPERTFPGTGNYGPSLRHIEEVKVHEVS